MNRPTLIMLCGLPASGKSTYARKLMEQNENIMHLSSDEIRAELWGDESIQGDPSQVFNLMQSRAFDYLNQGYNVIYDATNINRKNRASIISVCPKFAKIKCVVVWDTIENCIAKDKARERTVGREVIDKMVRRFQFPYYDEGIDEISIFQGDQWWPAKVDDYRQNVRINMLIKHDSPYHSLDIDAHNRLAKQYAQKYTKNINVWLAARWHDCGKPYCKTFVNTKDETTDIAHYYNHENVGAWIACGVTNEVDILWLISTHMEPFHNSKYYQKLPKYLKDMVDELHECDLAAH